MHDSHSKTDVPESEMSSLTCCYCSAQGMVSFNYIIHFPVITKATNLKSVITDQTTNLAVK